MAHTQSFCPHRGSHVPPSSFIQAPGLPSLPTIQRSLPEEKGLQASQSLSIHASPGEGEAIGRNIPELHHIDVYRQVTQSHNLSLTPLSEILAKTHPSLGLSSSSVRREGCTSPGSFSQWHSHQNHLAAYTHTSSPTLRFPIQPDGGGASRGFAFLMRLQVLLLLLGQHQRACGEMDGF